MLEMLDWIEELNVPSGSLAGRPLRLLPFQREILKGLFSPPRPRTGIISMPRKNGKTTLMAAILLYHLVGPGGEEGGEYYAAAADRDQASIIFRMIEAFLRARPDLAEQVAIRRYERSIEHKENGSIFRALSSEVGGKHGLSASLVVCDETAQWPDRELWDVLATSQGARDNPLIVAISTQAPHDEHWFSQLLDWGLDREVQGSSQPASSAELSTYTFLAGAPISADWHDPNVWADANPAMGIFRSAQDLQSNHEQIAFNPKHEAVFRNLFLNQRVALQQGIVPLSVWERQRVAIQPSGEVIIGVDAPSWEEPVLACYWLEEGLLTAETFSDQASLLERIDRQPNVVEVRCERTVGLEFANHWWHLKPVEFSFRGLASGTRWLAEGLRQGKVWHQGASLSKSFSSITFEQDMNGNRRPLRSHADGVIGDAGEPLIAAIAAATGALEYPGPPQLEGVQL